MSARTLHVVSFDIVSGTDATPVGGKNASLGKTILEFGKRRSGRFSALHRQRPRIGISLKPITLKTSSYPPSPDFAQPGPPFPKSVNRSAARSCRANGQKKQFNQLPRHTQDDGTGPAPSVLTETFDHAPRPRTCRMQALRCWLFAMPLRRRKGGPH